jgi:Ribosomal protein S1
MSEINNVNFDAIFEAFEEQTPIMAKVLESTGKGFNVDVFGLTSFLPGSETADKENVKEGDTIEVMVLKVNAAKANIVVSNRVIVEQKAEQLAQKALSEMQVGSIVQGVVKGITNFGAFIKVGPVDGLVHVNELSWQKVSDINAMLKIGDVVNVKIIDIEERKGVKKLALSIKQCEDDPWTVIKPEDYLDHIIEGTVTQVMDYGIFVHVGKVDGLVHASEMSWAPKTKEIKPSSLYSAGDKVTVKVMSCDMENRKMSLSIKATLPDPWDAVTDDMIGQEMEVTVTNTAKFGLFAEVLPNVEGLIHVSDLSWARVENADEVASVGEKLMVKIENIDRSRRQIALNHKVLVDNPWDDMHPMQYVGRIFDGVVTRIKKGVVYVKFAPELAGRLRDGEVPDNSLKVGDAVKVTPDFIDVNKKAIFLKLL